MCDNMHLRSELTLVYGLDRGVLGIPPIEFSSLEEGNVASEKSDSASSNGDEEKMVNSSIKVRILGSCTDEGCLGCKQKNCRTCESCLDMTKYGGPGTKKQRCKLRICRNRIGLPRDGENQERELEKDAGSSSPKKTICKDPVSSAIGTKGSKVPVRVRKVRCYKCRNCKQFSSGKNCRRCSVCIRMKRFGGRGTTNMCKKKICLNPKLLFMSGEKKLKDKKKIKTCPSQSKGKTNSLSKGTDTSGKNGSRSTEVAFQSLKDRKIRKQDFKASEETRKILSASKYHSNTLNPNRCYKCNGCHRLLKKIDCRICGPCKNMAKYGGQGLSQRICQQRLCTNPRVGAKSHPGLSDTKGVGKRASSVGNESGIQKTNTDGFKSSKVQKSTKLKVKSSKEKKRLCQKNGINNFNPGRCYECIGCQRLLKKIDCKKCIFCKDLPKYGGLGASHQICKMKACWNKVNKAFVKKKTTDRRDSNLKAQQKPFGVSYTKIKFRLGNEVLGAAPTKSLDSETYEGSNKQERSSSLNEKKHKVNLSNGNSDKSTQNKNRCYECDGCNNFVEDVNCDDCLGCNKARKTPHNRFCSKMFCLNRGLIRSRIEGVKETTAGIKTQIKKKNSKQAAKKSCSKKKRLEVRMTSNASEISALTQDKTVLNCSFCSRVCLGHSATIKHEGDCSRMAENRKKEMYSEEVSQSSGNYELSGEASDGRSAFESHGGELLTQSDGVPDDHEGIGNMSHDEPVWNCNFCSFVCLSQFAIIKHERHCSRTAENRRKKEMYSEEVSQSSGNYELSGEASDGRSAFESHGGELLTQSDGVPEDHEGIGNMSHDEPVWNCNFCSFVCLSQSAIIKHERHCSRMIEKRRRQKEKEMYRGKVSQSSGNHELSGEASEGRSAYESQGEEHPTQSDSVRENHEGIGNTSRGEALQFKIEKTDFELQLSVKGSTSNNDGTIGGAVQSRSGVSRELLDKRCCSVCGNHLHGNYECPVCSVMPSNNTAEEQVDLVPASLLLGKECTSGLDQGGYPIRNMVTQIANRLRLQQNQRYCGSLRNSILGGETSGRVNSNGVTNLVNISSSLDKTVKPLTIHKLTSECNKFWCFNSSEKRQKLFHKNPELPEVVQVIQKNLRNNKNISLIPREGSEDHGRCAQEKIETDVFEFQVVSSWMSW